MNVRYLKCSKIKQRINVSLLIFGVNFSPAQKHMSVQNLTLSFYMKAKVLLIKVSKNAKVFLTYYD